jgi:hypothetical protein
VKNLPGTSLLQSNDQGLPPRHGLPMRHNLPLVCSCSPATAEAKLLLLVRHGQAMSNWLQVMWVSCY